MRNKHYLTLFVVLATIGLLLSNPEESTYISRISYEFTSHHSEFDLSEEAIREIGSHQRVSYVLFSTYTHRIGKSKMYYFGIANNVFYLGSRRLARKEKELKVV